MKLLLCALIVFMSLDSCDQNGADKKRIEASLLKVLKIEYPSGSTLNLYQDKLYLMGDDARGILILDTAFNYLDTLPVSGSYFSDAPIHNDSLPGQKLRYLIAQHGLSILYKTH